jgi:hypothetical protein
MRISEAALAQVVGDASTKLQDPNYISSQVDQFVAHQPAVMQYVVAHKGELSVESIVQLLFQVALIGRSIEVAVGASPPLVDFRLLDEAASSTPDLETLAKSEPDVASFILSNLDFASAEEKDVAARLLAHIARAMIGRH